MAFDIFNNAEADKELIKQYITEITTIVGVEVKYMAVFDGEFDGIEDSEAVFKGEDPDISYKAPIIIKAVMNLPPEASKQWEAMGFFSVDMTNLYFGKEDIIAALGRRPMPRDRVYFTYNDTGFEVTDVLENTPYTFYDIFSLEVKLKKLVEGFEDSDVFTTIYPGSWLHPSAGSGATGVGASALSATGGDPTTAVPSASQELAISAAIEDLPGSAGSGVGISSAFGTSDDDLFGNW